MAEKSVKSGDRLDLPSWVDDVLTGYISSDFTTWGKRGRPSTAPVTPLWDKNKQELLVLTSVAFPQKAFNAKRDPNVSLLYTSPIGSDIKEPAPVVLVQGAASVENDLVANREILDETFPQFLKIQPGFAVIWNSAAWRWWYKYYLIRIIVRVRPLRVLAWKDGDCSQEPEIFELDASTFPGPSAVLPKPPGPASPIAKGSLKRIQAYSDGTLTTREADTGLFVSLPCEFVETGDSGTVVVKIAEGYVDETTDPTGASLSFHTHNAELAALGQQLVVGTAVVGDGGRVTVTPEWQMGFAAPEGLIAKFFLGMMSRKTGKKYFKNRPGPTPDMVAGPK